MVDGLAMTDYTGPLLALLAVGLLVVAAFAAPWWVPVGIVVVGVIIFVWW
jgi:hypothetical protein